MKKHTYICYQETNSARPIYLDQIFAGIKKTAAARREAVCTVTSPEEALERCAAFGVSCVILLLSDRAECTRVFHALAVKGIYVILANMGLADERGRYSTVEADYRETAYRLIAKLLTSGGQRPVFLGFNPHSHHDTLRLRGAYNACNEKGLAFQIIENRGDIAAAVSEFLARRDEFDTVICSNDFITHRLLTADPTITQLQIASLGGHMTFPNDGISSAKIDYEQLGTRIIDTYLLLSKCSFSVNITLRIPAKVDLTPSGHRTPGKAAADNFYQDKNVDLVERIQRMHSGADEIDHAILKRLKQGLTYEMIAEELYLSLRTVKSRSKKMFDIIGCRTKKEFLLLIRRDL